MGFKSENKQLASRSKSIDLNSSRLTNEQNRPIADNWRSFE